MNTRRRTLQGIFVGVTAAWALAFGGAALAATSPTVSGTITNGGVGVANANVNVVCAATGGSHTRNVVSTGTGHYSASFTAGQCDDGSPVTVTAASSDGANTGQASGQMGDGGTSQRLALDVNLSSVTPLPEFGVLTAAAGVGGVGVVVWRLRRRRVKTI